MLAMQADLPFVFLLSCIVPIRNFVVDSIPDAGHDGTCKLYSNQESEVSPIKTDTCILFYPTPNCSGNLAYKVFKFSDKLKFMPTIRSFIPCSIENQGFNVQIYNSFEQDVNLNTKPIAEFKNICKCVPMPTKLYLYTVFLHTEGQKGLTATSENCNGDLLPTYGGNFRPKYLEPFDRPINCPK